MLPLGVAEGLNILLEGERIASLFEHEGRASRTASAIPDQPHIVYDLDGLLLFPGLIDIHIHGAVGVDTMEATADDLHRVARFLASRGTTAWLPTLVPGPLEDYRRVSQAVGQLMLKQHERDPAARSLGIHYEGPFVNSAQHGALRAEFFKTYRSASDADVLLPVDAHGAAHLTTLAPEIEGGIELIRELRRRGWVVSIGHTRAGVEVLDQACEAGAQHMTHFMNAMSPMHHRAPGPIGWGLLRDDVTCDMIADGVHTDPLMLRLMMRCKSAERLALISDAVAPTGLGDGEYQIWGETISVREGRTRNLQGSIAGSVITVLDAVRMMLSLNVPAEEVARMAARNPARLLGLEESCGSIEAGRRADLVALDDKGNVKLTIIGGRVAFDAVRGSVSASTDS